MSAMFDRLAVKEAVSLRMSFVQKALDPCLGYVASVASTDECSFRNRSQGPAAGRRGIFLRWLTLNPSDCVFSHSGLVGAKGRCRRDGGGRVSLQGSGGASPCLAAASRQRRGARAGHEVPAGVSLPPLKGVF